MIVGTPPAIRYVLTLDDLVDGNRFVLRTFRLLVTGIGIVALAASAILWGSGGGPVVSVAALGYGVLDLALLWARPIERLDTEERPERREGAPAGWRPPDVEGELPAVGELAQAS